MGWAYSIIGRNLHDQEVQWTFKNDPSGHVYATPSTGDYMRYEDGSEVHLFGSPIRITWYEKFDQEHVQEARDALKKAEDEGGSLHHMNQDDLDNLINTPDILATSRERLEAAQKTFENGVSEAPKLYDEKDQWQGEAYDAYARKLDHFKHKFEDIIDDIEDLREAHGPLVDKIDDIAKGILQIYIDNINNTKRFLTEGISMATNPLSWSFAAKHAAEIITNAATNHHKDLQGKLNELKESFQFKNLVELAKVEKIDDWPKPLDIS